MREFLRWFGPALQQTYDTILLAPLSWKIIDAHEKLREAEEKKSEAQRLHDDSGGEARDDDQVGDGQNHGRVDGLPSERMDLSVSQNTPKH